MRSNSLLTRTVLGALALTATLASGGCSTLHTSHIVEPEPGPSLNAVASAEGYTAQPFSLVAADSVGLATFGTQIVYDDMRVQRQRIAEAN